MVLGAYARGRERTALHRSLPAAGGGDPFGAVHRQTGQHDHSRAVRGVSYALRYGRGHGRGYLPLYQEHLLSQQQGPQPRGHGPHALFGVRRRGAERSAADAAPAGRGPQDGQRAGRGVVAEGGDAGRYARLPRLEPHRPDNQLQNAPSDRADTRKEHSAAPAAGGPSLAHSPRPLCLHGPRPEVRRVRHRRVVPQIRRRP